MRTQFNANIPISKVFEQEKKPLTKAIENLRKAAEQDFDGMDAEELEALALMLEVEVQP